jgi:hypothetical protein
VTESGDSGTPLPKKLGIVEESTLLLWNAPDDLQLDLRAGVDVARKRSGSFDVVLAFFTARSQYERNLEALSKAIFPSGGLWIAWPKRASGRETDMTDDVARQAALPLGLVDNKVCAIDATWTGLRLVWRTELRTSSTPPEAVSS